MRTICLFFPPEVAIKKVKLVYEIVIENSDIFDSKLDMNYIVDMYMVFLYLNEYISEFDIEFVHMIKDRYYELKNKSVHQVSFLHLEILKYVKVLNLNFKIESKFYGLDVDVLFYEKDGANPVAVLEIHGYQHFFRNCDYMNGDSALKDRILKNILGDENVKTVEIFEWVVLPEEKKLEFIDKLLEKIPKNNV